MLWVALSLPELSLQIAGRGVPDTSPLVVRDGPGNRPFVLAANAVAREAGVEPGMTLAAAQALAGSLQVLPHDPAREVAALANLAGWAEQFTPTLSIEPHAGVLLEVAGSLKLFGGLAQLLSRIREGSRQLGYRAVLGVAPTPLAAWWLARARETLPGVRSCTDPAQLPVRLADIPLALLGWPEEAVALLHELGIKRIGACLALPRDGLARRLGPHFVAMLDRALGLQADPRPMYLPPESFASRIELPAEVENVQGLLFPLRRLLCEVEGWLRGRGAGVQQLMLIADHTQRRRSRIALGLAAPERDSTRLLVLLHERLMRAEFPAPVVAIGLHADTLLPYTPQNASFLPDTAMQTMHWRQLQEQLLARLGEGQVLALQPVEDHRPEHAWRIRSSLQPNFQPKAARSSPLQSNFGPAAPRSSPLPAGEGLEVRDRFPSSPTLLPGGEGSVERPVAVNGLERPSAVNGLERPGVRTSRNPLIAHSPRPLWLLCTPRALASHNETPEYRGPLILLAGPERIEAGWWDGHPVGRDYYVARSRRGELLWVYREHRAAQPWYLHGIFA